MHKYLMEVLHYFLGYERFTVEAENKEDAVKKGKQYVLTSAKHHWDNYDLNDVRCVKKLKG